MARFVLSSVASTLSVLLTLSVAACSGGEDVTVGKTDQQLKTKRDGTPTGNGSSCSWDGTADVPPVPSPDDPVTVSTDSPPDPGGPNKTDPGTAEGKDPGVVDGKDGQPNAGPIKDLPPSYNIGDDFKSLDGCNECACTARGIMCTMRACGSPPPGASGDTSPPNPGANGGKLPPNPGTCSAAARICKDGSLAKSGAGCSLICPEDGVKCTQEAKKCPDGSVVTRTGPKCEFAACAAPPPPGNCTREAKPCPDGKTYVTRTGPNCAFTACPK